MFTLILVDEEREVIQIHLLEAPRPHAALGREFGVHEAPAGTAVIEQRPVIVHDLLKESRGPRIRTEIFEPVGARALCTLPLTTARGRVGALSFLSLTPGVYDG